MDRHELFERITTFPLIAAELADDLLSGDFRSIFKGQGIDFDEVRHYEPGDDVRSIDWNVSARFGTPYVKQYREERELTVSVVLDCSASMHSGGKGPLSRYEQAVMAAALIAFSAERAGQPLGAVLFDRDITRIFKPRKGRSHTMAVITAALASAVPKGGSGLGKALSGTERLLRKRSLVVVISDFLCINWEQELGSLCRRHDVIAIKITDPLDTDMPKAGLLRFQDPETGIRLYAPTAFSAFREAWSGWHRDRSTSWEAICRRSGAAHKELSTAGEAAVELSRFFSGRRRI
ncbi:DUF58 domain-containing protein [Breznakiella homolactica]|uniref:DUF58 domain-containing protein n=1 Tax=Breznakiella homolactica TaxID=2798577 RepID=A0A7T7XM80_9SPIR|nr:DUF58 domain-containing protein [Breznakiella homolactica]QQO08954.1 DUF58 domain-containing protein [Breznakiella homolactica]